MARLVLKPFRVPTVDNATEVAKVQNGEIFIDNADGHPYYKDPDGNLKRGIVDMAANFPSIHPSLSLNFVNSKTAVQDA